MIILNILFVDGPSCRPSLIRFSLTPFVVQPCFGIQDITRFVFYTRLHCSQLGRSFYCMKRMCVFAIQTSTIELAHLRHFNLMLSLILLLPFAIN